jgi:hypothetical protein
MVMSDFQKDVLKSLFDKLLIGLLIALAGFVFNIVLTRYKEEQNFKFQLNTIRAQKIADTWEELNQVTFKVEQEILTLNDLLNADSTVVNILGPISIQKFEIDSISNNFKMILIKNKFWFGNSDFDTLWEYASFLNNIQNIKDLNSLTKFKGKLNLLQNNIIKMRDGILKE